MNDLPKLPPRYQDAFEVAKAKAELEYATRAKHFPNHPQFADLLELPLIIQNVFFAFCTQARNACRDGSWRVAQLSQAIDVAWPIICDFYFVRERGGYPEDKKSRSRVILWRTVIDDPQWKQHLSDFDALAEGACTPAVDRPKPEGAADTVARAQGAVPDGERRQESGKLESVEGSPEPAPQPGHRKRGRPKRFPDEKKAAALKLRTDGGSNRDAASMLYDKKYPTQQEVKNVSSILRHYRATVEKTPSADPKRRKPSRKPNKNGG